MTDFTWPGSYGSSGMHELRLRETKFGDGYLQRTGDGINNIEQKWEVQFLLRGDVEKNAIVSFLKSKSGGQSFTWVPFDDTIEVRVICRKWDVVPQGYGVSDIRCSFERVYE